MKKIKYSLVFLLLICCFSTFTTTVYAYNKIVEVYDNANLLTNSEEEKLKDYAQEFSDNVDINVLFATTDNAKGKTAMEYADDIYDEKTVNQTEYSGILFLIDMDNREIYISTAGNAITWLNDAEIERALDDGYNYITDAEYYETFEAMAEYALPTIEYWYESGDTATDDRYASPSTTYQTFGDKLSSSFSKCFSLLPASIILTVAFVLVSLVNHNKANKKVSATNYIKDGTYKIASNKKRLIRTYETVQRDYYKKSSSGGSSNGHRSGSSHSSSSGRSHGGGGRKF
jgi:uncharacterized protein